MKNILKNIISKKFQLIDARGEQRFLGLEPEPRKELKSGNIKGSKNLPFHELVNIKEGRTLKKKEELINNLQSLQSIEEEQVNHNDYDVDHLLTVEEEEKDEK